MASISLEEAISFCATLWLSHLSFSRTFSSSMDGPMSDLSGTSAGGSKLVVTHGPNLIQHAISSRARSLPTRSRLIARTPSVCGFRGVGGDFGQRLSFSTRFRGTSLF